MTASSGSGADAHAPLAGVKVLDFSQVVSGPICGRVLADLGADVVKLEPFEGDVIRHLEPKVGDGMSVYFTWANAGKRSITVNLRDPRGVELVGRLAMVSDVVLENFRPGVLEQFGLDASTLLVATPRSSTARSTVGVPRTRGRTDGRTPRWSRPRSGASSSMPGCVMRRWSRARTSTATSRLGCWQ